MYTGNIEARSRNHCFREKAVLHIYVVCLCVCECASAGVFLRACSLNNLACNASPDSTKFIDIIS